jgi:hypothetical protein
VKKTDAFDLLADISQDAWGEEDDSMGVSAGRNINHAHLLERLSFFCFVL